MLYNLLPDDKSEPSDQFESIDLEEVDRVLTVLKALKNQIASPLVQECLEAARYNIAHLAAAWEIPEVDDDEDFEDEDEEDEVDAA